MLNLKSFNVTIMTLFILMLSSGYALGNGFQGAYELRLESLPPKMLRALTPEYVAYLVVVDDRRFVLFDDIYIKNEEIHAKTECKGKYGFEGDWFVGTMKCPTAFGELPKSYEYLINLSGITEEELLEGHSVKIRSDMFAFSVGNTVSFAMTKLQSVPRP